MITDDKGVPLRNKKENRELLYEDVMDIDQSSVDFFYIGNGYVSSSDGGGHSISTYEGDVSQEAILKLKQNDLCAAEQFIALNVVGRVVGFGTVWPDRLQGGCVKDLSEWTISPLAVDPTMRRGRIGFRLFERMAQWAREQAAGKGKVAKSLFIEADDINPYAKQAYEKWIGKENCKRDDKRDSTICEKNLQ